MGTLVDLGLSCQSEVKKRLCEVISKFLAGVPNKYDEFKAGVYLHLVEGFEVDNFGAVGDRYLLDSLGIPDGPPEFYRKGAQLVIDFQQQHAESWWRSEGLLHARVVSYAEFDLTPPPGGQPPLAGSRYQQNGYHGVRQTEERILPTRLPFNSNVDRSLCSENQLLAAICEDLVGSRPVNSKALLAKVTGWLRLFVTGAPCLSCVGAMRQFQLLLPQVTLFVSIGDELQYDAMESPNRAS